MASIRTARRGSLLALTAYVPVAATVVLGGGSDRSLVAMGLVVGAPAIMLLGAGLAPSALGERIDALVVAIAFAVGMPVAAVTSFVISGWILDGFTGSSDLAGTVLRRGVTEALAAAPVVALAAGAWVLGVRRLGRGDRD